MMPWCNGSRSRRFRALASSLDSSTSLSFASRSWAFLWNSALSHVFRDVLSTPAALPPLLAILKNFILSKRENADIDETAEDRRQAIDDRRQTIDGRMSDTAAKANVLQALVERKKLEQAELGQKRAREELPEGEGVDLGPLDDFKDDAGPAVAGAPVNGDQAGPKEVFDDGLGKGGDGSGPAIDDEGEGDLVFREEDMDFIDDEGVADEQRVDFADDGNAPTQAEAEEAEEADDLSRMFEKGRRESTGDHAELARQAENLMAQMEAALDADREAFDHKQPALHKLRMLKKAEDAFGIQRMHDHLLRGGVLGVLKGWLEPMPDGSLPNSKVRAGVLQMLVSLKINTHDEEQRDWLKRSGVGKLVMLLTKLPEETIENQRVRVGNSVSV